MLLRGMIHEGVRAMARHYLDEHASFVGRADLLDRLRHQALAGEPFALLTAPAGRGKTSLLLRLARDLDAGGVRVAWVPVSLRFGTHRSATVEALLTTRLQVLLGQQGHWRDLLTTSDEEPRTEDEEPVTRSAREPLVVLLDGLDELQDTALLDALTGLTLPDGVRLLAAARPRLDHDAASWATRLRWDPCAHLDLPPLSLAEIADVAARHPESADAASLMARTGGDPLLLRVCMESLDIGDPLPDVADPAGLVGAWWSEQRARLQAPASELAAVALAALGAAGGVVPWSVLARVVGVTPDELRAALGSFARFVVDVPGQGLAFAHPRFSEVARWGFPEATAQAQQRYAALAREQRQTSDPEPYFLHFTAHHFEAAGAPDDDLHGLITPASLAAWRRHEGGVTGFLGELRAAWGRAERRQHAVWGTPAALEEVRRQAMYFKLESELQATEFSYSLELLAALVRHGLRSLDSVLASLAESRPRTFRQGSVRGLLPLLPDAHLPTIIDLATWHEWSPVPIVEHLIERGHHRLALDVVRGDPAGCGRLLPRLVPHLDAAEVLDAARAIIEAVSGGRSLDALAYLALLPASERAARLDALEQMALDHEAAGSSDWPHEHGRLAAFHAACGDRTQTWRWLGSIRRGVARGLSGAVLALSQAYHKVLAHLRPESLLALAHDDLTSLVCRTDLPRDVRARIGLVLVACFPGDASLALALPLAEEFAAMTWSRDYTPDAVRPALGATLLTDSPGVTTHGLLDALAHHPVADRAGFFARLPRWRREVSPPGLGAGERDHSVLSLLDAIVKHADDAHEALAREHLRELAHEGAPVWQAEGWERFFTRDEIRSLLQARIGAPLRLSQAEQEHQRLGEFAARCHERGAAADGIRRHLRALANDDKEALVSLLEATPEAGQGPLIDELLRRNDEQPDSDPGRQLRVIRSTGAAERLLRQYWQHRPCHMRGLHRLFEALPTDQRQALYDEVLQGTRPEDILETFFPLWGLSHLVPSGAAYRERVWAHLLAVLPGDLRRGDADSQAWRMTLGSVLPSLTAEQLLALEFSLAHPRTQSVDLGARAWALVEQGSPRSTALAAFARRCEDHAGGFWRRPLRRAQALAGTRLLPLAERVAALHHLLRDLYEPAPGEEGELDDPDTPRGLSHWMTDEMLGNRLLERGPSGGDLLTEAVLYDHAHSGLTPAGARRTLRDHWEHLSPASRAHLAPLVRQVEGATLCQLDPFADVISPADLRRSFGPDGLRELDRHWTPVDLLVGVAGPAALEAWGQGWLDALAYFTPPASPG